MLNDFTEKNLRRRANDPSSSAVTKAFDQ